MKRHVVSTKDSTMDVKKENIEVEEVKTKKRLKTSHADRENSVSSDKLSAQVLLGPPWTFNKIFELVADKNILLEWCVVKKLLSNTKFCSEGHLMTLDLNNHFGVYRCQKKHKNKKPEKISRSVGTWFHNSKITMERALLLAFCFTSNLTYKQTMDWSTFAKQTSSETICGWFGYCRELVAQHMDKQLLEEGEIGGIGLIVEVDRCVIKSRNDIDANDLCVMGLMERSTKRLRIAVYKNKKLIMPLIEKYVLKGSILMADDVKELVDLDQAGYEVFQTARCRVCDANTCNVQKEFSEEPSELSAIHSPSCAMKHPLSDPHINDLKCNWPELKKMICTVQQKQGFERLLTIRILEFLWRRKLQLENKDAFEELLFIIQQKFPI